MQTEDGKQALLITYTKGGTTPGDSYLWHFDESGKPRSYQMWVDILPISGLEATWDQWTETESGAFLPTTHKLFFLNLDMEEVKKFSESIVKHSDMFSVMDESYVSRIVILQNNCIFPV